MKQIDKFEELFMIFRSSLAQFGQELTDEDFTDEVKLVAWQTCNRLYALDRELEYEIEQIRKKSR